MTLRSWQFLFGAVLVGCSGNAKEKPVATPTDTADDETVDTGVYDTDSSPDDSSPDPDDIDEDGYTPAQGDCDESNPLVSPAAAEITGNDIDENCDGTLYETIPIGQHAVSLFGTAEMWAFGSIVTLEHAGQQNPGTVLVTGAANAGGQYGAPGEVHVFTAEEAVAGELAGTVLEYPGMEMAEFGGVSGAVQLIDSRAAWIVGFKDSSNYGGFCAWDSAVSGRVGVDDADACIPPFDGGLNRLPYDITANADLNGDGTDDLVMGGTTGENYPMVGAAWITYGPLDLPTLGAAPTALFTTLVGSPRINGPGDLTGDGYSDLLVANLSADGLATGSGQVNILPGGGVELVSMEVLDGIDGDQGSYNTGLAVAAPDLDGDGQLDLCVSAAIADNRPSSKVGCFLGPVVARLAFDESDFTFLADDDRTAFGRTLAALDLEDDGDDEIAIGRPGHNSPHATPGLVYLLDPMSSGAEPVGILAGQPNDRLSRAMEAADLDGDGRDDLVVGAPSTSTGEVAHGAAYLLLGGSRAW